MPPEFNPSFHSPGWGWAIVWYFFFGGITGGMYFCAAWLDLFGDDRDRGAVRLGHLLAFPLLLVCAVFLIADLGQPLRFWHMIFQSERFPLPIVKPYSPMSLGSVVLSVFGLFAFLSFADAVLFRRQPWLHADRNPLGKVVSALGGLAGLSLAGYTGVLLNVSNVPVWETNPWVGALFLFSGLSAGTALLVLLTRRQAHATADKLEEADTYFMAFELVTLVIFLATLGAVGTRFVFARPAVLTLFLVVLVVGLLVPLALHVLPALRRHAVGRSAILASTCVLVGGFVLRWALLAGPEGVGL